MYGRGLGGQALGGSPEGGRQDGPEQHLQGEHEDAGRIGDGLARAGSGMIGARIHR